MFRQYLLRFGRFLRAVLLALFAIAGCEREAISISDLEQALNGLIPLGSSVQRAVSVLDSLGAEHSAYDSTGGTLTAMFKETSRSLMVDGSIQVRMSFDSTGRLLRHSLREVLTAP